MEQLRIVPLTMFFVGALLIYSGFSGQKPTDVVRNALQGDGDEKEDLYTPDRNPIYSGVRTYSRPTSYGDRGYF